MKTSSLCIKLFIAIAIISTSTLYSIDYDDANRITYIKGYYNQQVTLTLNIIKENEILKLKNSELHLNITLPINDAYQTVSYNSIQKIYYDIEENPYTYVYEENPVFPFTYQLGPISFNVRARKITSLNGNQTYTREELYKYLIKDEKINYDESLKKVAEQIVENATNDFEAIALIADFVNKHINYDLNLVGQKRDAKWVYLNKRGVCVEYSHLFAALARSLGYPTRLVAGYAYSPLEKKSVGHLWNEVYINKTWIPVDATWLQVGYLDALHFITSRYASEEPTDRVLLNYLETDGTKDLQIKWSYSEPTMLEETYAYADKSQKFEIELAPEKYISYETYYAVIARIDGKFYGYEELELIPCRDQIEGYLFEVINISNKAVIEPNKTVYFIWLIKPYEKFNVKKIDYYLCPTTIRSRFHGTQILDLKIKRNLYEDLESYFILNATQVDGLNKIVKVLMRDNSARDYYIYTAHSKSIITENADIYPYRYGTNYIVITDALGSATLLSFNVRKPNLNHSRDYLKSIVANDTLEGSTATYCIEFNELDKYNNRIEYDEISVFLDGELIDKFLVPSQETICKELPKLQPGNHVITAKYKQTNTSSVFTIHKRSKLEVVPTKIIKSIDNYIYYFEIKKDEEITSFEIYHEKKKIDLNNNSFIIENPSDIIRLEVVWNDSFTSYSKDVTITAKEHQSILVYEKSMNRLDEKDKLDQKTQPIVENVPKETKDKKLCFTFLMLILFITSSHLLGLLSLAFS